MKNVLKRVLILVCVVSMALSLGACGRKVENIPVEKEQLISSIRFMMDVMTAIKPEVYDKLRDQYEAADMEESLKRMGISADGEAFFAAVQSLNDASEELGSFDPQGIKDEDIIITSDAEEVKAVITVTGDRTDTTGNLRQAEIEMIFNSKLKLTSSVTNIKRSFAENMQNAGLNTLLGMGTVFVVLIVIAIVIYCFKFIGVIEARMKEKKNAPIERAEAIDNALAHIAENEERSDDLELVAVISAAIAAYEAENGAPSTGDGYVVRSIKRIR